MPMDTPAFFNQTSATFIEQVANRMLALDPQGHEQLAPLANKIIHIKITDLDLGYYFLFPGGALVVQNSSERPASATISGKLSAFIASASADNSGDSIFKGELHFSGEVATASRFQEAIQSLEIDWQEPISKVFGDPIGHSIATGIKEVGNLASQFFTNLRQDIPEYLQEEARVTPCELELENFYQDISLARSQTDRLQARIERLNAHD